MRTAMRIINAICFVLMLPFWPLFWLLCRLEAKPCPQCASQWRTELVGEWDGEMWKCHACGHYWETPYKGK